jgi:hypothetical protein
MRIIATQQNLSEAFLGRHILRVGWDGLSGDCYEGDDNDDVDEEMVERFQPQYRNRAR